MIGDEHFSHTQTSSIIVDLEDARTIGASEANALLGECLTMTQQRFGTALRLAFDTVHMWWQSDPIEAEKPSQPSPERVAMSALMQRAVFLPRFQGVFEEAFQQRLQGHSRTAKRRVSTVFELTLVDHGDLKEQHALKQIIRAMHDASKDELYALNFRVRMLMREMPDGRPFDNPWNPDYVCDAFGSTCRELWRERAVWRPIMGQLVRFMTPHVVRLYRELNGFLQDRDVLPTLRVRLRAGDGDVRPRLAEGTSLYSTLFQMMNPQPTGPTYAGSPYSGATAASAYGTPSSYDPWLGQSRAPGAGGVAAGASASVLYAALDGLQHGSARTVGDVGLDVEAVLNGTCNFLPQIKTALADKTATPGRITMDIVAGLFDYLFDDPTSSDAVNSVFGRLQIPVLKAALADRNVFSDPRHPVRGLLETLADALIGLDTERAEDQALLEVAQRLSTRVRDQFADDVSVFATAKEELDAYLAAERPLIEQRLEESIAPLVQEDARAAARAAVQPELAARLVGKAVPLAIRAFLENEWLDRLAVVYREHGAESDVWRNELTFLSELLWSLTPKTNANERKRLSQIVPKLVRVFNDGRSVDAAAEPRRKAFLACMFMRHLTALRGAGGVPEAKTIQAATVDDGEPDEFDDQVAELVRGDWIEFSRPDDGKRVLAKLVWRSRQRTRLLFAYRNGSPAFVQSPEDLAKEFREGQTKVAVEAAPLFERALTQLIGRYSKPGQTRMALPAAKNQ